MKLEELPDEMPLDEESIKYQLLDTEVATRNSALNALWNIHQERLMSFLKYHHPGLNLEDSTEVILRAIQRYGDLFAAKGDWLDKPIYPVLARIALFIGKDKYRKLSKQHEREIDIAVEEISQKLKDTDLGAAWHAADTGFRQRITAEIRRVASTMKPRQRQVASVYAQSWALGLTENEAIQLIFEVSGERLTRNAYKRAWDEVRKKLQEPIKAIFEEEGVCLKNLR